MIDTVVICFYHLECSFYSITQLYITSWNSLKFRILLAVERGLVELRKLGIEQQLWEASRKEIDQSSAFSLSNHKSAKELDTLSWKIPGVYMDSNVSFLFFSTNFLYRLSTFTLFSQSGCTFIFYPCAFVIFYYIPLNWEFIVKCYFRMPCGLYDRWTSYPILSPKSSIDFFLSLALLYNLKSPICVFLPPKTYDWEEREEKKSLQIL